MYHGDLCSTGLIKHFITTSHITGIVYFGGYVPKDVTKYMTERLQCFINLLEILRNYKVRQTVQVLYIVHVHTHTEGWG